MAGKMIFICDDSILGFAFVYLLEQKQRGLSNKTTITKQEFLNIKEKVKNYANKIASPGDIIKEQPSKKEYFSLHEIRTGKREDMFYFDPLCQVYYTTKPLGYLQSSYNLRNSENPSIYNMYNNKEILSELTNPQSSK